MKRVFVISGPSGAGKSTLINKLLKECKDISTVVSHTTRAKRLNETDGIDYHFISKDQFQEMIIRDQFVEYIECFGNYYGTSIQSVKVAIEKNNTCIMDLEWNGASKILHGAIELENTKLAGILILPPSVKVLRNRLRARESETEESLERRIRESFVIEKITNYDYFIVNNDLQTSYKELKDICCDGNS